MSHAGNQPFPQPYAPAPAAKQRKRWPWVLAVVVAFGLGLLIGSASGGSPAPASTNKLGAPVVPASPAPAGGGLTEETWTVDTDAHREVPPVGSYADGKYEVGAEIQPGTYKTDGADGGLPCTWEKYKTADDNAIPSSADVVNGRGTVTIKPGGYMKFTGGCEWVLQK